MRVIYERELGVFIDILFEILYDFCLHFLVLPFMFLWLNMQVIAVTYRSHGDSAIAVIAIDAVSTFNVCSLW